MTNHHYTGKKLSTDRLGALRDYYTNKPDGQGDYEDIFFHIDAVETERDALREALEEALPWIGVSEGRRGNWCPPEVKEAARAALERPE